MPVVKAHKKSKKQRTEQLGLFLVGKGQQELRDIKTKPKYSVDLSLSEKDMQTKIKKHAFRKYQLKLHVNTSGVMSGANGTQYKVGIKGQGDLVGEFDCGVAVECEVKSPKGGTWLKSQQQRKIDLEEKNAVYLGPVHNCIEFDDVIRPYLSYQKQIDWNDEFLGEIVFDPRNNIK